eukprot:scaffold31682_cov31-Tisochrysis_lutea.AAC.1
MKASRLISKRQGLRLRGSRSRSRECERGTRRLPVGRLGHNGAVCPQHPMSAWQGVGGCGSRGGVRTGERGGSWAPPWVNQGSYSVLSNRNTVRTAMHFPGLASDVGRQVVERCDG